MTLLNTVIAAALFAALPAAAAPAKPPAPIVITQPDWLEKPSGEDLSENYPSIASKLGLGGVATISCSVSAEGLLVDCRAVTERPADLGFGRAAILMSSKFRMRPLSVNGKPVDGGTVRIPLRFALPVDKAPPPPQPISPEAESQAERLVDGLHGVEGALAGWETSAHDIETEDDDQIPIGTRAAAADALRRAAVAHRQDLRTASARAFAAVFSESEMSSLADFANGPGAALNGNEALQKALPLANAEYWREASTTAHAIFCAKRACSAPADLQKVWRPADPRDIARIDNPIWAEQPGEALVSAAAPPVAGLLGFSGLVRLTCKAAPTGGLNDCSVDEEAPTGFGYGSAALALALAGGYRLSAIQLSDGGAGKKVTVRIGFPAPLLPPPFTAPAGSPGASALAQKLAGGPETAVIARRNTELAIANYASRPPQGADKKVYEAGLDAFRAGSEAALNHYIEQSVNIWATSFTEPQLEAIAAFRASPAGKAQEERQEELNIATGRALEYVYDKVLADARATFCKAHDCSTTGAPHQSIGDSSDPSARKP